MKVTRRRLYALTLVFVFAFILALSFAATVYADPEDIRCCTRPPDENCLSCNGWKFYWEDDTMCRCQQAPYNIPCPWTYPECY